MLVTLEASEYMMPGFISNIYTVAIQEYTVANSFLTLNFGSGSINIVNVNQSWLLKSRSQHIVIIKKGHGIIL